MTNDATADPQALPRVGALTLILWILAALLEGIDLQSAGIAGPGMRAQFGLTPTQLGAVFSIGNAGLALSAALGGYLADRYGRKRVLVWAVIVFGVFSLATTQAWSLASLLAARVLTGLGLGAAIPNLIALVFESSEPRRRNTLVGLTYCAMPFGSALAAAIGWAGLTRYDWRLIFYCGGLAPVLIAPLLATYLRESPAFLARRLGSASPVTLSAPLEARDSVAHVLFGQGRAFTTATLWFASFWTYFVLYLLMSWLPTLLVNHGFSGSAASAILVLFNLGGVTGIAVGGALMDRWRHTSVVLFVYAGLVAIVLLLSNVLAGGVALLLCAFAADFFAASSQMVEYGLAPLYYGSANRGVGLGSMVAFGRTGAIVGPYLAGPLSALGAGIVVSSGVPGVLLSAGALMTILTRARAARSR